VCCRQLGAQTSPTAQPSPAAPVRVYTREVLVDINVTDAKGNFVHGLTRDNFTVLEDGKPMTPRSFREHTPDQQPASSPTPAGPSLPPNTFTNAAAPDTGRPLNILLLDSLDIPIATQAILRQRVADFVDKVPQGTRLAVMGLSATGQLSLIQGFTSDRELLKKAVKSRAFDMQIPPLEDSGQEQESGPVDQGPQNARVAKAQKSTQPAYDANLECNHAAARGEYTITALTQIGHYLSGMPGRKNLIWYTGAFPTRMTNKQNDLCYDLRDDLGAAEGWLSHSQVTVYSIDPRALDALAQHDPTSRIVRRQAAEHLVMEAFAEHTGGKTFYASNDLAAGAQQAIEAGSNFYAITYIPTNQTWDTRRRSITVQVDQPGLNLLYRPDYRAVPPGETLRSGPVVRATPLQSAMMRGTLQPTDIVFQVGAALAPATDASLPTGNIPDPKAMKPPYRHVTLTYTIDINGLQFDQAPDGSYHGQFEYAVNVYDPGDGKLLNSSAMAAKPSLPPAVYQSMLSSGVKLHQDVALPAKGDYILRIGVHDTTTDRLGALEIPASSITP
jgi:VWFA-related protein